MPHLGWLFMVDEDFDAFGNAVERACGSVTWSTTSPDVQVWPTLRAACSAPWKPILIRSPSQDVAIWMMPPRHLDQKTLRGGDLSHSMPPSALRADQRSASFVQAIRRAFVDVTRPWIQTPSGDPVRRYRIGLDAVEWVKADAERTLRDESSPFLSYRLDPTR